MHSITVIVGSASLRFLFKSKEKAETFKNFKTDHPTQDLHIDDDFGQHGEFKATSIHGVLIEDMDVSKLAAVEIMLHNTRIQATAQHRAQSDSQLRSAQQGPRVLSPMGGMNGM